MMAEDAKDIVIWCDNCAAQNKNWTLCTSIARFMNSSADIVPQTVTLKISGNWAYFYACRLISWTSGNKYASQKNVFNFHDFVTVIQTCGGSPQTVEMQPQDFTEWDKR
ncbi:U-box domain-containing protein 16, partial [Elysia marginata]